ncbi:MAG: hypothetical protein K6G91_06435 [Kiritimatiellae bacterium]|nr:hypothetical protein [Kiritimatiellia bacterium]
MQWVCNWPEASSQTFALYQGETAEFEPIFKVNGKAVTNVSIYAVWYQTNGMDQAWWKLDGNVFAPSNDVGAASYRFFVESRETPNSQLTTHNSKIYRANGTLRMLPSPGYVPNAIEPPIVTLDFASLNVLNAPWLEDETDPTVPAWAKAENPPQTDISGKADKTEVAAAAQAATNYTDSATALTPVFSEWTIYRDGVDVTAQMQEQPHWVDDSWSEGVFFRGYWSVWCYHSADDVVNWDIVYDPHATIITAYSNDYWGGHHTYTATRQFLGYTLGSQADKMLASTNSLSALSERLAVAAQSATNYTDSTASSLYPKSQGETLATQVAAIGAVLNGEDARFVVTNYDSVVHTPEAYVEVQVSNEWLRVWREGARWEKHEAETHTWKTNMEAEVSHKADRAWGAYDSETGGYSPDGYTQLSSSNILVASGMAYQRTVTSDGAVWVLQCNSGVATIGGSTNGAFRVMDGDGETQFEIVQGDKRVIGADADGISVSGSTCTITYSVIADSHPILEITGDLQTPNWKAETDDDCIATVDWSGVSGAYVARVQRKSPGPSLFVKASYMAGGETYIRNIAPVKFDGGVLCTDGVHKVRPVYNNGSITWEVVQ